MAEQNGSGQVYGVRVSHDDLPTIYVPFVKLACK